MCFKRVCSLPERTFTMSCAIHGISNIACVSKEVSDSQTFPACINNPFANYAQKKSQHIPGEGTIYKLSRHHEPK